MSIKVVGGTQCMSLRVFFIQNCILNNSVAATPDSRESILNLNCLACFSIAVARAAPILLLQFFCGGLLARVNLLIQRYHMSAMAFATLVRVVTASTQSTTQHPTSC